MMKSRRIIKKKILISPFNGFFFFTRKLLIFIYTSKKKIFCKLASDSKYQNSKSYNHITHLIKSENIVNVIIESQTAASKSSKKVEPFNCCHQKVTILALE